MKRHAHTAATVALLALTLLGSACNGSDQVPPDRVVTPSQAPSEPPPKKPVMPEAATEKTITGAREFTEHYYNLVEYGHATGKWRPVKKLSSKDCDVCTLFWTKHQQLFADDEDILVDVGDPDELGIRKGKIDIDVGIEVGIGLENAASRIERIERIEKMWNDQVTISYDQTWNVVKIEPDQAEPSNSCIAGRCLDFQKNRAKGGDDG